MIGNYNWGLKTKGDLNVMAKIYFAYMFIKAKKISRKINTTTFTNNENDFTIPDSTLVNQTIEFLRDSHQEFLINHCFRTYQFGNIIGQNESIKFDKELFAVASLMHDVGLTEKHRFKHTNCNCFAIEGALEAGLFLEKQNVDKDKIKVIQDAISLHLNIKIPRDLPEAYLLNKGAAVDVIGQNLKNFNSDFLIKIIEKYPRLSFKTEIHELMKHQCRQRPKSRISFLYENGFSTLINKSKFDE